MPFGGSVITFYSMSETDGSADALGHLEVVSTITPAPGCRHRPLPYKEVVELGLDLATEWWRSTLPLVEYGAALRSAVMGAKARDVISVDGVEYQIDGGIRSHPAMDGSPFKATIISKKYH
jgi:hypothetical protein